MTSMFPRSQWVGFSVLCLMLLIGRPTRAGLTFYPTQASFNGAAPNLPTETFEEASFPPGAFAYAFPGTLSSSTRNNAFTGGITQTGITFGSAVVDSSGNPTGASGPGLVVTASGANPGGSQSLGVLALNTAMEITLANANTIGLNLFASPGPGIVVPASFLVEVFGATGLLGTETVASSSTSGFFGVASTAAITKIDIVEQGATAGTFVDNVAFGTVTPTTPAPPVDPRSAFLAAHPGLSTEGFEAAEVAAGTAQTIAGPLNYRSSNDAFNPGDLLPGLTLSSIGSDPNNLLIAVGTGTIPGATRAVGLNDPANTLDLAFNQGQSAVGLTLLLSTAVGNVSTGYVDVLVYSAQGLIDSQRILVSSVNTFLGLAESQAITRIDLSAETAGQFLFVDDVSFAPALDPTPVAVPEPASLALSGLGLAVALGVARRSRRVLPPLAG